MNKLFIVPMVVLSLFSCSEEKESVTDQKSYDVSFNVNNLDVSVGDITPGTTTKAMTRSETAISDKVHSISYFIYNANTLKFVTSGTSSFKTGETIPSDFGTFKIKLPTGEYTIVFYGLGKSGGNGYGYLQSGEQYNNICYFDTHDQEIFYYSGKITVDQNSTNYSIDLPRISGLLQVSITDDLTSDIGSVKIHVEERNKWQMTEGESTYKESKFYDNNAALDKTKMQPFSCYILAPQTPTVVITVYDKEKNVLLTKKIQAPIYRNRKTIISGKLFSTISDRGFTVTISDQWGDDYNVDL